MTHHESLLSSRDEKHALGPSPVPQGEVSADPAVCAAITEAVRKAGHDTKHVIATTPPRSVVDPVTNTSWVIRSGSDLAPPVSER